MSDDETLVTVVSLLLGPGFWAYWLFRLWRLPLRQSGQVGRVVMTATLILCGVLIYVVLRTWASFDVVDAPQYVSMYVVLGLAWLRLLEKSFAFLGLSVRDDVAERGNRSAALALAGAFVGVTACYAGGNIGDGPGWWVVVFSAALATATWLAAWFALAFLTPVADAVAIDRDPAAGLRLGAFLAASGLVMGRAVAGDWMSTGATVSDFVTTAPPALLILALATFVEHRARPTAERPHAPVVGFGIVPAAAYLTLALAAVARLGRP